MDNGIYAALTGCLAQVRRLDLMSNNLANANTAGFKVDTPVFEQFNTPKPATVQGPFVAESMNEAYVMGATPRQNQYAACAGTITDHSPGPLNETGGSLDMAIKGKGFFAIETPGGERYTRNGCFSRSSEGDLVTAEGHAVLNTNGERINLSESGEVIVQKDGLILQDDNPVGSLRIVDFPDKLVLEKEGDNCFKYNGNTPPAGPDEIHVLQGCYERSNVNVVKGIVTMIEVTRQFGAYQKVISFLKNAESRCINEVGKLA